MGIFTRFRDIISSNINSMLDSAEDPEKMIKLMIREMEDTLVEIKAACAGAMASEKKVARQLNQVRSKAQYWQDRAQLAADKGRDDLAREALREKRRYVEWSQTLESETVEHQGLVTQYKEDIRQLEEKLKNARDKQRLLVQRHIQAARKIQAQSEIRRADSYQALHKFDELENRIERMEAEATLYNLGGKGRLEGEIDQLEPIDEEIENELAALKSRAGDKKNDNGQIESGSKGK
jgi:phage shock protein A